MWRILILVAAIGAGFAGGWQVQAWRRLAQETKAANRIVYITREQGAINTTAAAQAVAAQDRIRTVTRMITKDVPVYVTPETDTRYPLPVGFVRLHDAAATGVEVSAVPDAAGRPDDAASDVKSSEAADVIAGNYGQCREDQARLRGLQAWIGAQTKVFNLAH